MIPKIIHYCWFGRNNKSQEILDCLDSWKRFFPGWEIKEWNEDNYDISKYPYASDAYALKKWAFVSDIVRLDVLYEYGGVYLDVDVEFIKPLPEEYLSYTGFCGFEHTAIVAPGLIFAIQPKQQFIKNVLDSYQNEHFELNKKGVYKTINMRITNILEEEGLERNNKMQDINGIVVFPSEYFCGYDTDIHEPEITEKTICWHHYLGSWVKPTLKMKCQNVLKRIVGKKIYRRLLYLKRKISVKF